jgi:hypothetical protein
MTWRTNLWLSMREDVEQPLYRVFDVSHSERLRYPSHRAGSNEPQSVAAVSRQDRHWSCGSEIGATEVGHQGL